MKGFRATGSPRSASRRCATLFLLAVFLGASAGADAATSRKQTSPRSLSGGAPPACARVRFDLGGPLPLTAASGGAVADFDGDGRADFAVYDIGGMKVFLGDGAGGFRPGPAFPANAGSPAIVAGDFDEDGHPDLVFAGLSGLTIFLGDGAGGFAPGDPIPPIGSSGFPIRVAVGDFDGDGHLDLVQLNDAGSQVAVTIALGDGHGHFAGQTTAGAGFFPISVQTADFDEDGNLDVAVVVRGGIQIYLGDGNGGLSAPLFLSVLPGSASSAAIGDFNGDGHLDLALAAVEAQVLKVYLGDGHGNFGAPQDFPADQFPQFVVAGDWDGDGNLDLAIVSDIACDLTFLKGDGLGGFALVGNRKFIATRPVNDLRLGDFNGDGIPDFLVLSEISSSVLLADGAGGVTTDRIVLVGAHPWAMAVADFDGDGHLDIATANIDTDDVSVVLGDGAGGFGSPASYSAGSQPLGIVAGDFDEDGHPDLAVTDFGTNTVSVLLNDGHGAFLAPQPFSVGVGPWGLAVADFNGDHHLDLAIANNGSGEVSIRLGDGHGNFAGATSLLPGAPPKGVLGVDLDGDGRVDLLSANTGALALSVFPGNGDGTFGPRADYAADFGGRALAVADINEDGNLDIAMALDEFGVKLYFGDGHMGFAPGARYDFGSFLGDLALADFDGDGHIDLAATNTDFGNFAVLLGDGTGQFPVGLGYGSGGVPNSMKAADFDEDGRVDLAIAAYTAGGVTMLLNRSFSVLPSALPQPSLLVPYAASLMQLGGTPPVTFSLAGALPGGLAFDAATATISGIPTGVGVFPITVTATDAGGCATSRMYGLTVEGTRTLIVVTSSSGHSIFGQTLTLTATVTTDPPGAPPPTGTVTFTIDGVAQPPVALVDGVATLTVENLSVGTHAVVASYSGDSTHAASTSAAFPQIVLAAAVPALGLPGAAMLAILLGVAGIVALRRVA